MMRFQKFVFGTLMAGLLPTFAAMAQSVAEKQAQQPIPSGSNFLDLCIGAFRVLGQGDLDRLR